MKDERINACSILFWIVSVSPVPHAESYNFKKTQKQQMLLTLSHIQQICRRRLWKRLGKSTENPKKYERTLMESSLKHGDQRRNCLFSAIYSFDTMFLKSCLLQRHQKVSMRKRVSDEFHPIQYLYNVCFYIMISHIFLKTFRSALLG